ncbi:uncharacterized protein I206_104260 [Kwoniella pini CBS 10737]|uniref:RanBD1 domain-containing protein n=1 Tax=Kwoniella pini CBS 10737 TaxID=1296096 RepID=A0A1B9I273_9TREE|nr:uncharacterized protein I206_04164 [Kwoniella pini CBS 10737]OCF49642.1 hypothetical protein I206_04164 [Kwoniella pini CBS 10737]
MAKRGADNQKTREGGDSDEEQIEDPGSRGVPLAPVEGRVIRGMPKRKGFGGGVPAPTPAAAPAATSSPFSGFSFGQTAAPPASSSSPFTFGGSSAPAATPAAAPGPTAALASSNPFSGFSFSKPADPPAAPASTPLAETPKPSTPAFSFGAKPTASTPAISTPSTVPVAAPPKPFANFSFGKPAASAPVPVAGTFPPATSSAPLPASNPFAFGSSSTPSTSASEAVASDPPAPVSTETSGKNDVELPKESSASINGPTASQSTPPPEGEVSYYTSLRGLNNSILSFLTSTVKDDSFIDLSVVLPALTKQYDEHLARAAKNAGWQPEGKKAPAVNGDSSKVANGFSAPAAAAPTFKMPAAPTSGGFSLPKAPTPSTSTSTPSFEGFTPSATPGPPTTGFAFGGAKPAALAPTPDKPETPKKPSAEVTKLVEDVISGRPDEKKEAPKPFTFGAASTSTSTPESSKKAPSSLFSFAPSGPLHPSTPESKSFSPSNNLENATPAKLGKFGPGGSQPQLAFGGAKSSPGQATPGTSASTANKPSSFGFGFGAGATSNANPSPAPKPAAAPSFSFGSSTNPSASASSSTTPSFSFGSTSSTAPKPSSTPAFGFGGSTSGSTPSFSFGSKPASTSAAPAASGGFSFTPYNPNPSVVADNNPADNATSGDLPPENSEPSKNLAETTGAGEENEDTLVEQRGKLNRLENGEFKLEGLGQFKLKRSKEVVDGKKKRRLLMRTDGSGHVILNMSVSSSFNPTVEGPHVRFLGFDNDGKPVPYALRVKNAEVAKKIADELQKEVDVIKGE